MEKALSVRKMLYTDKINPVNRPGGIIPMLISIQNSVFLLAFRCLQNYLLRRQGTNTIFKAYVCNTISYLH